MTDRITPTGFASFKAEGVKPLPTEPVQVYEDSQFWNKVRDMADQEDRIKQMAEEAGIQAPWEYDGHSQDVPWMADTDALAKFAALVAEDCARVVADETNAAMDQWGLGMDAYHASERAEQAIRARYPKPD